MKGFDGDCVHIERAAIIVLLQCISHKTRRLYYARVRTEMMNTVGFPGTRKSCAVKGGRNQEGTRAKKKQIKLSGRAKCFYALAQGAEVRAARALRGVYNG